MTQKGEKLIVEGYALPDYDGVFYMKLDGDVAFKSIAHACMHALVTVGGNLYVLSVI